MEKCNISLGNSCDGESDPPVEPPVSDGESDPPVEPPVKKETTDVGITASCTSAAVSHSVSVSGMAIEESSPPQPSTSSTQVLGPSQHDISDDDKPRVVREDPNTAPYVPTSVAELSNVVSLRDWPNLNVRVIGMITYNEYNQAFLLNVNEKEARSQIELDIGLLEQNPKADTTYEVYGNVFMHKDECNGDSKLKLLVKFLRMLNPANVPHLIKAYEMFMETCCPTVKPIKVTPIL